MLTFTAKDGSTIRLTGGEKPLTIYPTKGKGAEKDGLTLLSIPEEESTPGVLSWPGEFNISGMTFRGIGHDEGRQVSFIVESDGVRSLFLSSPLQDWTDHELEMAGEIDVLVLPTDDSKLAQKLIDEFDPRILLLVPSKEHAAIAKIVAPKETTEEYKLKGSLPAEGREVMVLSS